MTKIINRPARGLAISAVALAFAFPAFAQQSTDTTEPSDPVTEGGEEILESIEDSAAPETEPTGSQADGGAADGGGQTATDTGAQSEQVQTGGNDAAMPEAAAEGEIPSGQTAGGTGNTGGGSATATPQSIPETADADESAQGQSNLDSGDLARDGAQTSNAQSGQDMQRQNRQMNGMSQSETTGRDAMPSQNRQQAQGQGQGMDMEQFADDIYERGFRQGYIRGIRDARRSIRQQMIMQEEMRREEMERRDRQRRMQEQRRQMQQGQAQGERRNQDGGQIIVLPPGVDPQALLDRLMQESQRGSN